MLRRRRTEMPELGLFYVRTVVEMYLHMFMAEDYKGVIRQLPSAIHFLLRYRVKPQYQTDKAQLFAYAKNILQKAAATLSFEAYAD
jgi:hypothetical protein